MNRDQFVQHDTFGSRQDTATVLVGTAQENELVVRHHIASTMGGYWISNTLADLVFDSEGEVDIEEPDNEPDNETPAQAPAEGKGTTKASGNRAAKTNSTEGE